MKWGYGNYHQLFHSMPLDTVPNQDFLKFLSQQGDKRKLPNLEMILNLENRFPGMFVKVMLNFDKARLFRESLDENGMPIIVSWEDALERFYLSNRYEDVTEENADIAKLFGEKGLSQSVFKSASKLRTKSRKANIPEHILGKTLREESILESIERIKGQTEEELVNGKEMIEDLYDKKFTYEWLSKNDPHNSIMGLFCSCCGTITSNAYGRYIAMASVLAPNVQNLVVRNSKGEIISKGTMYVNKKKGYAVINDFELNKRYRNHEGRSGRYNVMPTSQEEEEREMIFKAFQRGIKAFIKEYDEQNPEKPLNQVNVGMGYNRLKRQVEKFNIATNNLQVPYEYGFRDAEDDQQYVLYKREEEKEENER